MELRSKTMVEFQAAGPAEIVRLSQKDDSYLANLRSQVTALVRSVKGARWWILNHRELEVATDFLYYALTTLLGNQTLGEEYVNVIQINSNKTNVPSTLRRLLMVALHTGGPYAANHWAEWIRRNLTTRPDFLSDRPRLRNFLEHVTIPRLAQTVAILHRCHLLLFYFRVRYYHFAKRLVGVRYVLIRPWLGDGLSRWGYWILGLLSLVQLLLSMAIYAYSYWSTHSTSKYEMRQRYSSRQSESESLLTDSGRPKTRSCPLCLEKLESPTATPCGHVFCWQCILQSLEIKQQCPLCNGSFGPSRLIHLRNYDT